MIQNGSLNVTSATYLKDRRARKDEEATMSFGQAVDRYVSRRSFIGGSDARIIMGTEEAPLLRLWRENAAKPSPRTCPAI
jgi:hypothetical protein